MIFLERLVSWRGGSLRYNVICDVMCEVAFDFLRGSKPLKKCLEFGFQVFSKMNKGLKKMKNDLIWG